MDSSIVVGVDGSPASRAALRWAVEEAGFRGCAVDAVLAWHVDYGMVIGPVSATMAASVDRGEVEAGNRSALDELLAGTGAGVRAVLAEGDARDVLVRASRNAQMLVVGSRGAGPIRAAVLGSVSSYCVHHAHCPVVVVREPRAEHAGTGAHTEPRPIITPGPLL
ncbi:universal stress protein [Saccharothrix algeriensis]|uniref:Nucleotide-binding universal stress UspA family protein n=1 Tax=Saccharothrix algeriensis TaxID=173560 RepID=A0A8T8I029_9PSEU|nr:universal stress protein [Saccharothrix algeriensis]MBM7809715.1 nucleotide-binding universal stress UspA family protein [Saccharothrix algeriensis]QTR04007.1 universal stress protein [Saccharothrix algeriensis]